MGSYTGGHNADKRTTMKKQNRSAALGRPAMKLLGGGGGSYTGGHNADKRTTMKKQNRSAALGRPAMKLLGGGGGRGIEVPP